MLIMTPNRREFLVRRVADVVHIKSDYPRIVPKVQPGVVIFFICAADCGLSLPNN
jgi:hypothetical protein